MPTSVFSVRLLTFAVVTLTSGCSSPGSDPRVQVVLAINTVPPDVACVRVTAAGPERTVIRELDVVPGLMLSESFSGLPLGTVVFSADAFSAGCDVVTRATVPVWLSDPAPTAVVLGRIASVALTLHRNGRARVGVDFADEPACSAGAVACLSSSECCSRVCSRGLCHPPDGGLDAGEAADAP
jgi:hypothetical protein